jgi:hypothetical protein
VPCCSSENRQVSSAAMLIAREARKEAPVGHSVDVDPERKLLVAWIELVADTRGVSGWSSPARRDVLRRGEVKLLALRRVGQRLSTLCENVTYPRREYQRCYLGSLNRQARRSRGDEGAPVCRSRPGNFSVDDVCCIRRRDPK